MKRIRLFTGFVVLVAVVLMLSMGRGGHAGAATASKTSAKFYDPQLFVGTGGGGANFGSLGCRTGTETPAQFGVPLNLPDGASVTKVTFYYFDTNSTYNLTFNIGAAWIREKERPDQVMHDSIVSPLTESGDGGGAKIDLVPPSPVPVDNADRDVSIGVGFGVCDLGGEGSPDPTLLFDGARVEYTVK